MTTDNQNPFDPLIDELESSLKTFISVYNIDLIENKTNQELNTSKKATLSEHNKTNIEQNTNELYEKAQNLETLFLKHRLFISQKAPVQLIQEEIQCLKAELKRKDDILVDTKKKLAECENVLKSCGVSLDSQLKLRLDMSTHGYLPNENQPVHPVNTPNYEKQVSNENNVILLQ